MEYYGCEIVCRLTRAQTLSTHLWYKKTRLKMKKAAIVLMTLA